MAVSATKRAEIKARECAVVLAMLQARPTTANEFYGAGITTFKLRISNLRKQGYDIRGAKLSDGGRRFSYWGRKGQRVQLPLFDEPAPATPAAKGDTPTDIGDR